MRNSITLLIFFICLVANTTTVTAAAKKNKEEIKAAKEFREGIKTHQDWIDKFKETYDYRIFKMLASRGGALVNVDLAKKMTKFLMDNPGRMDEVFKKWRIVLNHQQIEEDAIYKWRQQYGAKTLILPTSTSSRKKARYLTLATKEDATYAKMITYYMEKIHKLYHNKFKTDEEVEGKFIIKLFPNHSDFASTGGPSFAFAYFRASTRELVGYVPRDKGWTKKFITDTLIHTFFHEGFHQFLSYYVPDPPTWLNEGFAEMFESIQVRGSKLYEGKLINSGDLQRIKGYVKSNSYTPLKNIIFASQKEFYSNVDINYPQGWSLVHFLAFGSPKYRKFFMGVIVNLKNGMDRKEALEDIFSSVNWSKMELAWKSYVLKTKNITGKNSYK
jgi:hypothetical protein